MQKQTSKEKKELNFGHKYLFGIGDLGFNWMTNIETYYFSYFLTNVAMFPLALVSIISTVGSTIDALLSWTYGIVLNKMKPLKWGRYRSILVVLPWLVPFLYLFQFKAFGNGTAAAVIVIVGTVTSHIAWNFPYVANMAMVNVAAADAEQRNALSSVRGMWTYIARCTYSYVGPALVAFCASRLGEANGYAAAAFILGCVMAAGYFAHFVMFKGYEETGAEEIARMEREAAAKKEQNGGSAKKVGLVAAIAANPQILGVLGSYCLYMMNSFCYSAFAVYYGDYVAQSASFTMIYLFLANITAVAGSIVCKRVAKRFSGKGAYQLAFLVIAVMYGLAYIVRFNPTMVIVCTTVAGFFTAFVTVMVVPMLSNCAIYSEYKTGVNCTGTIMGFINIPIKVAVVTRGILISAVLAVTGFSATIAVEDATQSVKNGIAAGFTIIPAILVLLGLLAVTFGYHLTDDKIAEYSAEIAKKRG
ncbi:MAG: MFS transporter [Eubacteriales bacterium]|nr:MFS transporter [Eubacteriales bacterium]